MSHSLPSAPPLDAHDAPPSYDRATQADSMPPSYESLFGEFRQVDSPSGLATFLNKAITAIANTVAVAVLLALLNIVPIGMIVIGAINKDNCPVQPMIPKWLMVSGCCYLTKAAIGYWQKLQHKRGEDGKLPAIVRLFLSLLNAFMAVWFILGTIFVYWTQSVVSFNVNSPEYCDHFTFVFSFVFITLTYVLLILSCFAFCCCCCCLCLRPNRHEQGSNA